MIWLFIKNIKIERLFRKLNHKWIDFYKIKKTLKEVCQLELFSSMKIHDTFHTSLLRLATTNSLIEKMQSSSSSIVINEEEEYKVNDILDNCYHYDKLQYRMIWIDHLSNKTWYSTKNFEHSRESLDDYHRRYSNKSKSKLRLIASITSIIDYFY